MKRFIPALVVWFMVFTIGAFAALKEDYTQKDVRDPRLLEKHLEALAVDVKAQTDSATTTDTTDYTPEYIGQLLVGKVGNTNSVWVARTVSTNGWQKIAP